MRRFQTPLSIFLLLVFIYISFSSLMPKEGTPASVPETEFSTERALVHLKEISKAPHYIGTDEHRRVREYLLRELTQLGLQPHIQEGFVMNPTWKSLDKSKNIIARLEGTDTSKALLLMSHYDSALTPSFGASDAGSGIVTILETMRAYIASGKKPKNDIIILFTDAEEVGLDGARLFVKEHPWAKEVGLALNFEARGSGGPSNMIVETNGGNKNLIKAFKEANVNYPTASSLMYSIYKMLPNDTDSTVLREEADIDGYFFAFIDDHYDYHTANDTFENLDENTLQHQGEYLLPLVHYFADADLLSLKSNEDDVYINVPFIKMISYPFSWVYPMLILSIIVFIGLLIMGLRNQSLSIKQMGKGFIPFLLALVVCGVIGVYGWKLLLNLYPNYTEIQHGFTYNGHAYILFFVILCLGVLFSIYHSFSKSITVVNLLIAPLFFWILINTLVAIYLKGAAFFILPIYFGLLSLGLLIRNRKSNLIVMTLLGALAIFLFAPHIQSFPVGLGLKMLVASCIFTVLLFGLLLPALGFYKHKQRIALILYVLAIAFFVKAHLDSDFSETRQKPNSLVFYQDADTNNSFWATYDQILDPWTQEYFGDTPEAASTYLEAASGSKYNKGYSYAVPTNKKNIPLFKTVISRDTLENEEVVFKIIPQRKVNQISIYTEEEITFNSLTFNGQGLPLQDENTKEKQKIKSKELVRYYVSDSDSLEVRYSVSNKKPVTFTVMEYSYDLLTNPLFAIKERESNMMPKPFVVTDAVIVKKSITID